MRKLSLIGCLFLLAFILGCSNDSDVYQDVPLTVKVPENFPPMVYDLSSNPPTQKGFELGRKLFYEGRLASDGVVSCGFCHVQSYAFTHHGHTVSHGVNNAAGKRNARPFKIWPIKAVLCGTELVICSIPSPLYHCSVKLR